MQSRSGEGTSRLAWHCETGSEDMTILTPVSYDLVQQRLGLFRLRRRANSSLQGLADEAKPWLRLAETSCSHPSVFSEEICGARCEGCTEFFTYVSGASPQPLPQRQIPVNLCSLPPLPAAKAGLWSGIFRILALCAAGPLKVVQCQMLFRCGMAGNSPSTCATVSHS